MIINSPSINPTETDPVGPLKGIDEIERAIDEPIIAIVSGLAFWSIDNTVATTCTSFLYPFGNKGLIGRSISLDVRIERSEGLPSLFIKPPGILPAAYNFSS